jgi:hypothetical protein
MSTSNTSASEPPYESLVERLVAEGPIGMSAAAKLYGTHRGGRPTHPSTPTRHCLKGVPLADGSTLHLEFFRIHGRMMTSRQAVLRFFSAQQRAVAPQPNPGRTPTRRQRESLRAEEELKRIGV